MILGEKTPIPSSPDIKTLETFISPGIDTVNFYTGEFTSLCPVTQAPDFCSVNINYSPKIYCVESKSLKLYLQSYRNEQGFIEQLCCRICQDIFDAIDPVLISVTLECTPRGGISLRAHKTLEQEEE
jgi:7-cyano-7-deazaguanine reductase